MLDSVIPFRSQARVEILIPMLMTVSALLVRCVSLITRSLMGNCSNNHVVTPITGVQRMSDYLLYLIQTRQLYLAMGCDVMAETLMELIQDEIKSKGAI